MSASPSHPPILTKPAAQLVDREHLKTNSAFLVWVAEQQTQAERRIADRNTEIERFETEIQRSLADHQTTAARLEAEIQSRVELNTDDQEIIDRATIALTLDLKANRPAPTLTPIGGAPEAAAAVAEALDVPADGTTTEGDQS